MTLPFVTCTTHDGGPVLGYVVCVHVLDDGAAVAHIIGPSISDLGEVLCSACYADPPTEEALRLVCERCMDKFFGRSV